VHATKDVFRFFRTSNPLLARSIIIRKFAIISCSTCDEAFAARHGDDVGLHRQSHRPNKKGTHKNAHHHTTIVSITKPCDHAALDMMRSKMHARCHVLIANRLEIVLM
jgi:hypothetical protein